MLLLELLFMFFLVFLALALAGPRWGVRKVTDFRRGVDLVLAFDLSLSMNVEDCQEPGQDSVSRLEQGKAIALQLMTSLGDIRVGTAIGKGNGILAVPLTYDIETVLGFIYALDSRSISGSGTNLEALVNTAIAAFQDSIPSRREILLFSDGEAHSGSFQAAVERARRAGINISAVGLGTDQGGPVPVEKSSDAPDGLLLGTDGRPVLSVRQSESLRNGVERSGGVYIDGSMENAASLLAKNINAVFAEARIQGQRREAYPRWRLFVFAAMSCLGGARLMGFSRRKKKYLAVLFCLLSLSSCAKTQGQLLIMQANFQNTRGYYTEAISSYMKALEYDEAAPYAEYGLASTFFSLDESSAALDRYDQAEKDLEQRNEFHQELRYRIHYNKGIIYFEKGEYGEAALAFREALKVDGSRIEAKRNLELSLLTGLRSRQSYTREEAEDSKEDSGSLILFEYIKAKEQSQWKSREWSGESDHVGLDY
jgi:Ca-activated chloride channel family protein